MTNNLRGNWFGEYSFNQRNEDNPEVTFYCFELKIKGDNDDFNGIFSDKTLKTKKTQIKGFEDDGFISFIRESKHEQEFEDSFNFMEADSERLYEFNFSGNYNSEENAFEGIWEVVVEEENQGFQNNQIEEIRTGAWYMRKI
jgi:hypothetical protein